MKSDIQSMQDLWDGVKTKENSLNEIRKIKFDEIVSSIFTTGPFYYYLIDFYNMSISNLSSGFEEIHGDKIESVTDINGILNLIHIDDMKFVNEAEEKALNFVQETIGAEKFTRYKVSYNFRMKIANGSYQLFNHQALLLTMNENYKFMKSLNIHTNISHLTKRNNSKFSLIGLAGEPSYLNLDVYNKTDGIESSSITDNIFTKREIEIIKLLAEGYGTKTIAEKLFISPTTTETHRKNILRKSGCDNSVMLIAKSFSEGWI